MIRKEGPREPVITAERKGLPREPRASLQEQQKVDGAAEGGMGRTAEGAILSLGFSLN